MPRAFWITACFLTLLLLGGAGAVGSYPSALEPPAAESAVRPSTRSHPESVIDLVPVPISLRIPAIAVEADIEARPRTSDGRIGVPQAWENVAWDKEGPAPGERGRAAIAGHLDSTTGPAVFWHLERLTPGDEIIVTDAAGTARTFRVTRSAAYDEAAAPLEEIFQGGPGRELVLITCDGTWSAERRTYNERLVVYAELSATSSAKRTSRSS